MIERLGALALGFITPPGTTSSGVAAIIDLAVTLDNLGYSRLWLAEHHERASSHSAPEILTAVLAGLTERLRVGPGGMLMRYYSPLKIAKVFRLLECLYPSRVDLGIAGGNASDAAVHAQLCDGSPLKVNFDRKVTELIRLIMTPGLIEVNPHVGPPEVWLLGAGIRTATLAAASGARLGLGITTSALEAPLAALSEYRQRLVSTQAGGPHFLVALAGVCAEDERAARRAASEFQTMYEPLVVGSPSQCAEILNGLSETFDCSEIVFIDLSPTPEGRLRSYSLLAEACRLKPVS